MPHTGRDISQKFPCVWPTIKHRSASAERGGFLLSGQIRFPQLVYNFESSIHHEQSFCWLRGIPRRVFKRNLNHEGTPTKRRRDIAQAWLNRKRFTKGGAS